jgi:RNA polymerase sigma-70 factor (ECF subfamily)
VTKKIDLQAIVSEHYGALYRFGLALAKNENEAADLTQETFLILVKQQKQIREPKRIKCWLFTTLRREFLRKIRVHTAHPEVKFQPEEHEVQAMEPSVLRSIDARTAFAALQMVEESYRSALELFYLGLAIGNKVRLTLSGEVRHGSDIGHSHLVVTDLVRSSDVRRLLTEVVVQDGAQEFHVTFRGLCPLSPAVVLVRNILLLLPDGVKLVVSAPAGAIILDFLRTNHPAITIRPETY